ncbi:uncharacterized protein LODBEIA_P16890 [Lodderomyces beijingensis]|uniref:Uncharacterized protein n=1 Tax=Lodderomyces beijingensis TaxID=1775926 RepID=A0ABP0ZH25_9ASCO
MVTTTATIESVNHTTASTPTSTSNSTRIPLKASVVGRTTGHPSRQEIIDNLLSLARQEQAKGNSSITSDKLDKLQSILEEKNRKQTSPSPAAGEEENKYRKFQRVPAIPKQARPLPKLPSLFDKFDVKKAVSKPSPAAPAPAPGVKAETSKRQKSSNRNKKGIKYFRPRKFTLKQLESMFINVLENIANLLDNLHLLSNLPMFPQFLTKLLKQTNKLWVLILVFLIRKTISQLLNVIRKIRKVNTEKEILNSKSPDKSVLNQDINKKYNKVLKDLKFDKLMLVIELIGNFLDLSFNVIELYGIVLPDWIMSSLNFASMAMTIYRMNKDDEYVDDDITEDLI